jgi:hypothetical protein
LALTITPVLPFDRRGLPNDRTGLKIQRHTISARIVASFEKAAEKRKICPSKLNYANGTIRFEMIEMPRFKWGFEIRLAVGNPDPEKEKPSE